jgi:hypothetical protein
LDGIKLSDDDDDDDDGELVLINKIGSRILTIIEVKNERKRNKQMVVNE